MNFEGHSGSRSQEICGLFAKFMEWTYANEPCMPSDPRPDDVSDEPSFGSLQFIVLEVLNALLDLDSNKGRGPDGVVLRRLHCHFVCSSTGHWHLAFVLISGISRLLLLYLRVGNAMMFRTILVFKYCRRRDGW
jgi:hypothetical protein